MRSKLLDMLLRLMYWYDGRSSSFRERANPALWKEARELLADVLMSEGIRKFVSIVDGKKKKSVEGGGR